MAAASRRGTRAADLDQTPRCLAAEPRQRPTGAAVRQAGAGRRLRTAEVGPTGRIRGRPLRQALRRRISAADRRVDRTGDVPLRHRVARRTRAAATDRQRGADGTRQGDRTGTRRAGRRDPVDHRFGALHRLHRSGFGSRRCHPDIRRRSHHPADGPYLSAGVQRRPHRTRRGQPMPTTTPEMRSADPFRTPRFRWTGCE